MSAAALEATRRNERCSRESLAATVHDWHDYLPLAKSETSKFYRKQERGKFRYEELLNVAVEALGDAAIAFDCTRNNGLAAYATKGIRGALKDYVRDAYKIVRNVEMPEEKYLRTRGCPNTLLAVIRRVCVAKEARAWNLPKYVRHTFFTDGPYRTNLQLLQGVYKVNSKHGKVSVAIGRSTYKDGWNQTIGGWNCANIYDEDRARTAAIEYAYVGAAVGSRRAMVAAMRTALSDGMRLTQPVVRKSHERAADTMSIVIRKARRALKPSYIRDDGAAMIEIKPHECVNFKFEDATYADAGAREFSPPGDRCGRVCPWRKDHDIRLVEIFYIPRKAVPTLDFSVRRRGFGLKQVPKDKLGHWCEELALEGRLLLRAQSPDWQRSAGYFGVGWGPINWPRQGQWTGNWLKAYLDRWSVEREKKRPEIRRYMLRIAT